jgi:hypothetical protein
MLPETARGVLTVYRIRRRTAEKREQTGGLKGQKSVVDIMERVIGSLRPEGPLRLDRAECEDRDPAQRLARSSAGRSRAPRSVKAGMWPTGRRPNR